MASKIKHMTLDEALRPTIMTCDKCEGELTVYPAPIPTGTGFCHTCSPAWLQSFALFLTNQERDKHGLKRLS